MATDREHILKYQDTVLKALAWEIDDFYLVGGTALSLFYFQHRLSADLDFFTGKFSPGRVKEIISHLEKKLGKEIKLIGQNSAKDNIRIQVYNIYITKNYALKVDFVEDFLALLKQPKVLDGIKISSLEDIYIRKLYAISGTVQTQDATGRNKFLGGRAEAKDLFDIYFLSSTFMPLSKFADKYGNDTIREGLITWFRTYDRMNMADGIMSLETEKKADYKKIEKHLSVEIGKIIKGYTYNI